MTALQLIITQIRLLFIPLNVLIHVYISKREALTAFPHKKNFFCLNLTYFRLEIEANFMTLRNKTLSNHLPQKKDQNKAIAGDGWAGVVLQYYKLRNNSISHIHTSQ